MKMESWVFVVGALLFGSILVPLYIRIKKLRPLKEVLEEYHSSKQMQSSEDTAEVEA